MLLPLLVIHSYFYKNYWYTLEGEKSELFPHRYFKNHFTDINAKSLSCDGSLLLALPIPSKWAKIGAWPTGAQSFSGDKVMNRGQPGPRNMSSCPKGKAF